MRRSTIVAALALVCALSAVAHADTEYSVTLTGCSIAAGASTCQGNVFTGSQYFVARFSTPAGFDELYIHNNGLRALDGTGDTSINQLRIDLSGASFLDLLGSIIGTPQNIKDDLVVFFTTVNHPDGYSLTYHIMPNANGITPISFYAPRGDAFTSIQLGVGEEHDATTAKFFGFDDIRFSGPSNTVPEPASMVLLGTGLLTAGTVLRKRLL
jgi:PEP-CTERM motif